MKTQILLTTIGAAVLAAITINASDIALSPRAAANQIKTVPDTTVVQAAPATGIALSPRDVGNQIVTVKGTETVAVKCSATGSPKHLAAVGNAARMTCCKLTLAECPTMSTCSSAK